MTAPNSLDAARAGALLATLHRRQRIRIDADFLAARRKIGWLPAGVYRAAESLTADNLAHFETDGESVAIVLGPMPNVAGVQQ